MKPTESDLKWQVAPPASGSVDEYRAAMREASALALELWRKHYQDEAPNFRLSDTAAGVITQIDNMVCSLVKPNRARRV